MTMDEQKPTVSVSVAMKVNLGNYESADAFISVSGLEAGATEAQIEQLLDTGKLAWGMLTTRLGAKVAEMRQSGKA
jgi:hypothetical protein